MQSERARLLERAERNRHRAQKCRDLMGAIDNRQSVALLEELALDLEATAVTLEAEAEAAELPRAKPEARAAGREQHSD